YFHAGLATAAVLLALGNQTLFFRLAYDLVPGYATNRFPVRVWVLAAFAAAVLAGFGADALLSARDRTGRRRAARTAHVVRRLLGAVTLLAAASLSATFYLLDGPTRVHNALYLVIDLVILAGLLAATLGFLPSAARASPARAVASLVC